MNQELNSPVLDGPYSSKLHRLRSISWGAVIAGVVAAAALEVLFVMLGAGLGLALYTPITDSNPASSFGTGAVLIEGFSAVVALWCGGWVAGRFIPAPGRHTAGLHGFVVWCSATVAGVMIVAGGAGWATSSLAKIVGGGLSLAGQPAAAVAGKATEAAKDAAMQSKSTIASFVDEAGGNAPPGATRASAIKTKREVGLALARLFDPSQKANLADNKTAAAKVLTQDAGMAQADADRTVNEWTDTYQKLQDEITNAKNQAAEKARVEANEASKDLSVLSFGAFVAFLIGAGSAICGGCIGGRAARKYETTLIAS